MVSRPYDGSYNTYPPEDSSPTKIEPFQQADRFIAVSGDWDAIYEDANIFPVAMWVCVDVGVVGMIFDPEFNTGVLRRGDQRRGLKGYFKVESMELSNEG